MDNEERDYIVDRIRGHEIMKEDVPLPIMKEIIDSEKQMLLEKVFDALETTIENIINLFMEYHDLSIDKISDEQKKSLDNIRKIISDIDTDIDDFDIIELLKKIFDNNIR